jgi:uroporphyrinogen decarboxylase
MRFEEVDRIPFWADWLGPSEVWREQGLSIPAGAEAELADEKVWFVEHFGFEGMYSAFWGHPRVPVNIGPHPGFEREVFEQTESYQIYRSSNGVIVRQFSHPGSSLISTQFLEYPIKDRSGWERYRDERLDPGAPGRYPDQAEWDALKRRWRARENAISVDGGSFYGFLRDWIGFEALSYLLYDDPGLVHEMMDYLADFFIAVLHRALDEVDIDFAMFWEDMCYKTGPLLSPAMFREFMLAPYHRVTSFLEEHGVALSWVDCDGNIEALLPLWIEGGVHGFYPLEVASDMDAGKLRAQYGQEIVMWGNVDKRALIRGRGAIDREMARLAPVVAQGGFIPLVDHGVPDDVPYPNYLYYLEQRKRLTGWA